jgi:hypothetical protein
VTLRLSGTEGSVAEALAQVRVGPPGRVTGLDDVSGRVLISLGAGNGVRVGDRFAVDRASDEVDRTDPVLEVIELIDEERAACRIVDGADEPRLDERLVPVDVGPCAPVD